MILQPLQLARYGVYLALAVASGSVLLAHNAGDPLDLALLRALFVFLIFTALAFGADAILHSVPPQRRGPQRRPEKAEEAPQSSEESPEGDAE